MPRFIIDCNIAKAKTIDSSYYLSRQYFEESKDRIFSSSWQYAADASLIAEEGNAYPFILLEKYLDEPLVLTRDTQSKLHCLSNVCTHRGNLMVYKPCRINQMRCKYHGRLFSLDGKFISMPEFKEVENFPTEDDHLKSLPLFNMGSLIFTSLISSSPDAYFGDMLQRIHWFPFHLLKFKPELSKDYSVKASWALYCENYLEGFHIPFVHAGLNQVLNFGEYSTELFSYSSLQLGIGKKDDVCFDLPENSVDYGKNVAAYYFWVFPNMMFNFYPWGLSLNIVRPVAVDECIVSFLSFVSDETKLNSGAGSGLDTVELEDEEVVQMVQKGIKSRFYNQGRYSVKHEKGTHHFHSLIAASMQ